MLDTTLAMHFEPGTNLRGAAGGANWVFVLPTLELGRVVCVGAPGPAALSTLSRLADEVAIVGNGDAPARDVADGTADLVVLDGAAGAQRLARDREAILRLLRPGGLVYLEEPWRGFPHAHPAHAGARYWLAPRFGPAEAVVPAHDHRTIGRLRRRAAYTPRLQAPVLRHGERLVTRLAPIAAVNGRAGVILGGPAPESAPPAYLRALAAEAGIDLEGRRWALSAFGAYPSKKVLLTILEPGGEHVELVVKITRDPALNPRLENATRALALLHEGGIGAPGTLPRVAFAGHHAGLAVLAETAVEGTELRAPARPGDGGPALRAALDWLADLAGVTAEPAPPADAAATLGVLLDRFCAVYGESDRELLEAQIAVIGAADAFPTVFQHGDPGAWNILVAPGPRVAFLDWEAAERRGMPLWDLFHLVWSVGVASARRAGTRDPVRGFERHFVRDGPLAVLLAAEVHRLCRRLGLARELVEPLLLTSLMHRALKETTRLRPEDVQHGRYVRTLRLVAERRAAPGLRRLLNG